MKKRLQGSLCLLTATIIWGMAFIAQSVGMDHIGPFTFQTVRCAIAVPFLMLVIFLFDKDKKAYIREWTKPKLWKSGIICGSALFAASGAQQVGLVYTSAGKAGFITAMYIVLVPFFGLFLKKKPSPAAWVSVVIATVGLYLLSCFGVTEINIGDLFLMVCALFYAVQITLVDIHAGDLDSLRLNCIQSIVCAVLSAVFMFFTETPTLENIRSCWLPLCYAGILSMGIAFSLQIVGQKHLESTPASLIMSLESVFAVLFSWLMLHETMSGHEAVGCVLVFAAVILSQIPSKKHD